MTTTDVGQSDGPSGDDESFSSQIQRLIQEVKNGNPQAAEEFFRKYEPKILTVIRRRMNGKVRDRYDSQDFTQAVWCSFFTNPDEYAGISTEEELLRLLIRMASNKTIDAGRRVQVRKDRPAGSGVDSSEIFQDLRRNFKEPTPSQHVQAKEEYSRLKQDETPSHIMVFELRCNGLTQSEIAEKVGISERQVRRILKKFEEKNRGSQEGSE